MNANEINAALASCSGTFELPVGQHAVRQAITIPPGKRLKGAGKAPTPFAGIDYQSSSVLDVRWGAGQPGQIETAAVILNAGATIENVASDYSIVQPDNAAPTPWGSTIMPLDYDKGSLSQSVIGCMFNRAYVAIDFRGSKTGQGIVNPTITGNYGTPLHTAIWLDFLVDWAVIRDNFFNSGAISATHSSSALEEWVAANGHVIRLGGNDWASLDNIQAWGYKCGVAITGDDGYQATGPYRIRNCSFDATLYGVYVNASTFYRQLISVEGCNFCPFYPYPNPPQQGFPFAAPGASGVGIMFNHNYIFGPAAGNIMQLPRTNFALIEVTGNQADGGAGNPWLDATGAASLFNVNFNQFRGYR